MTTQIAIAWLLEEDWAQWQKVDPELPGYGRWLAKIEALETSVKSKSIQCERVVVKPEKFTEWCATNGLKVGRESRSQYAAQILANRRTAH